MAESNDGVRPGIDRAWLAEAVRRDPVMHSLAAWDLDHEPDRARILSCGPPREPAAYLLLWWGDPQRPAVHWVGDPTAGAPLLEHLPPRPLVVLGPEALVPAIESRRGPIVARGIARLTVRPTAPVPGSDDPRVRAVGPIDGERLRLWAHRHADPMVQGYAFFDPARHLVWAAWDERDRVAGVCFASARLPEIWTFTAIYVEPERRGAGIGTALTAHATEAARRAGALAHLNVRLDNPGARRIYERLGYRERDRIASMESVGDGPHNG